MWEKVVHRKVMLITDIYSCWMHDYNVASPKWNEYIL